MDQVPNSQDKPSDGGRNIDKSNMISTDDSIPNNSAKDFKINKYIIIAIVVVIILLILAYLFYHYNILGVRLLVRHTLGLSTPSSTSSGLTTLYSFKAYP